MNKPKDITSAVIVTGVLIVLAVLALPKSCYSANLEIGASQSQYGSAGDNMWFDSDYQHSNRLRATGAILGASGAFNNWLGWRSWLVDFGHTSNSAVWPEDSDFFARDGAKPIYRGQGSGEAYGLTLAPVVSYSLAGVILQAEAGAFVYTARWREQVQAIEGGSWTYYSQGWHTDYTPYFGLTTSYQHVFVTYRKYRDIYAVDSVFGNSLKQYTLGYQWSF